MILLIKCNYCHKQTRIRKSTTDRASLERTIGSNTVRISCPNCSHEEIRSINEVKAKESRFISAVAFLFFLGGTGAIALFLKEYLTVPNSPYNALLIAGTLLIPSVVYVLLHKQERENVKRFNRYRV